MAQAFCQRCDKVISSAPEGVCPVCGSKLATYYSPGEKVEGNRTRRGRDIGQAIGSMLTSGSSFGVVVGHTIGKVLEGKTDFLREGLSFHPLPPEPEMKIDIRFTTETLNRVTKALDGLLQPTKRLNSKRTTKSTKAKKPRKK